MYLKRTSLIKTRLSAEQTKQIKEVVSLNSDTENILRIIGYSAQQIKDIFDCLNSNSEYISVTEGKTEYLAEDYGEVWWMDNKHSAMEFENDYVYEFVEE